MKRFHPNDKNKSQNESKEETKEKKVKVELVHGKHDCLLLIFPILMLKGFFLTVLFWISRSGMLVFLRARVVKTA